MGEYRRTAFQRRNDLEESRAWEDEVRKHLPSYAIVRTDSTTELDFFLPGLYLEAKEKKQKLTKRWHLVEGVDEINLFILDELSLRKALVHAPYSYFVLRDIPGGDRLFVASSMEVAVSEKVRRNRVKKGKLILDLQQFRQISSLEDLMPAVVDDVHRFAWKQSPCMTRGPELAQV